MSTPKIIDDDNGTVRAEVDGYEIRSWQYQSRDDQRHKMQMAREFAEGWYQADRPQIGEPLKVYLKRAFRHAWRAFCIALTGKYDYSGWNGQFDYLQYQWRGKTYCHPNPRPSGPPISRKARKDMGNIY